MGTKADRPCKIERVWAAASVTDKATGKTWGYDEFSTRPGQDHREDGRGIVIQPVIDNRAQPWNQLARANIHEKDITYFPSESATVQEVKEYLFLVLAKGNVKDSKLDLDAKPHLISNVVQRWKGTGKTLRNLTLEEWCDVCPARWLDVAGDMHDNPRTDRDMVGKHIYSVIHPLVFAEKIDEASECNKRKPVCLPNTQRSLLTESSQTRRPRPQRRLPRRGFPRSPVSSDGFCALGKSPRKRRSGLTMTLFLSIKRRRLWTAKLAIGGRLA